MNYEKIINQEVYKSIDRSFADLVRRTGADSVTQADVLGSILRRKLSEYIAESVDGIKNSFKKEGDVP